MTVYFYFFVEDKTTKEALKKLVPKIIKGDYKIEKITSFQGIGKVPKKAKAKNVKDRTLLGNLPSILKSFEQYFKGYEESEYRGVVIVVCDLDNKCKTDFLKILQGCLDDCKVPSCTKFCLAIEEIEAWFLGDIDAVKKAYPKADSKKLNKYKNDSICGTWEWLFEAIDKKKHGKKRTKIIGMRKSEWVQEIAPHMDVENNKSPSFCYFRETLRNIMAQS